MLEGNDESWDDRTRLGEEENHVVLMLVDQGSEEAENVKRKNNSLKRGGRVSLDVVGKERKSKHTSSGVAAG